MFSYFHRCLTNFHNDVLIYWNVLIRRILYTLLSPPADQQPIPGTSSLDDHHQSQLLMLRFDEHDAIKPYIVSYPESPWQQKTSVVTGEDACNLYLQQRFATFHLITSSRLLRVCNYFGTFCYAVISQWYFYFHLNIWHSFHLQSAVNGREAQSYNADLEATAVCHHHIKA